MLREKPLPMGGATTKHSSKIGFRLPLVGYDMAFHVFFQIIDIYNIDPQRTSLSREDRVVGKDRCIIRERISDDCHIVETHISRVVLDNSCRILFFIKRMRLKHPCFFQRFDIPQLGFVYCRWYRVEIDVHDIQSVFVDCTKQFRENSYIIYYDIHCTSFHLMDWQAR